MRSATRRMHVSLPIDTAERLSYWAGRREQTMSDYIADAVDERIARENRDYDLPTAEIARLNQLIDAIASLDASTRESMRMMQAGFASLIDLARGETSYLEDADERGGDRR